MAMAHEIVRRGHGRIVEIHAHHRRGEEVGRDCIDRKSWRKKLEKKGCSREYARLNKKGQDKKA